MIPDLLDEFLNPSQADIPPFFEPGWNVWLWLGMWALLILCTLYLSRVESFWKAASSLDGTPATLGRIGVVVASLPALWVLFTMPFKMMRHTESWGTFWGVFLAFVALAVLAFFARSLEIILAYDDSALAPWVVMILVAILAIIAAITEAVTKFAGQIPTSVSGLLGFGGLIIVAAIIFLIYTSFSNRSRSY